MSIVGKKIAVFLTTRYGSTRLPGKALLSVGEDTVTDILIERVLKAKLPVIMTTPMTPEDIKYMCPIAARHLMRYYAGANENIIKRHIDCAQANDVEWIINVDGDDILTCPELIKDVVDVIMSNPSSDCVQTCGYPVGMNLIAYTPERLKRVKYKKDTNWGSKVFSAGSAYRFGIGGMGNGKLFSDYRLSLDWIEDFFVIKQIIDALGWYADSNAICTYMTEHPEICLINNFRELEYRKRLEALSK